MVVSRDCPNFSVTPYYLRNGKSYGFKIWLAYSEGPSEQKPIKILGKRERGRSPNYINIDRVVRTAKLKLVDVGVVAFLSAVR